jgi:hypothetical protein
MDIIKELKLGSIENNFVDSLSYIEEQQNLWNKKSHIFKVISLINRLEQVKNDGLFDEHEIEFIEILHKYNSPNGNFIKFNFFNADKEEVASLNHGVYNEVYNKLVSYFDALDGFNEEYIGKRDFELNVNLNKNIKEQILSVLLSQELKTVVEFSQMQIELEHNSNVDLSKKPKI